MLKMMAVTTGLWEPAARFRVRDLIAPLSRCGISCEEVVPSVSAYPPVNSFYRPPWLLAALATRIPLAFRARSADVVLFQRELISTLSTLECLFKSPRILDVDDAIYLSQRWGSVARVAGWCELVICGNPYLAEIFSRWNKNVKVLPTGVDTARYTPADESHSSNRTIGWIGTSSNLSYLYSIEPALKIVLHARPGVVLKVVSDKPAIFRDLPAGQVQNIRWAPDTDVELIRSFSVGVMPLSDTEWARGKCSFKLLQYYACGVPAVASPVGMNADVLKSAEAGLSAESVKDWVDCLLGLLDNQGEAHSRGRAGRQLVERDYSLPVIASRLSAIVKEVVG